MMSAFFAMGGYGVYIWTSYGLAAAAIGLLVWRSLAARARARRLVAQLEAAGDERP